MIGNCQQDILLEFYRKAPKLKEGFSYVDLEYIYWDTDTSHKCVIYIGGFITGGIVKFAGITVDLAIEKIPHGMLKETRLKYV